jgi:hypothetical protein
MYGFVERARRERMATDETVRKRSRGNRSREIPRPSAAGSWQSFS